CSAWILSVPQAPEPFAWLLLGVAACALVLELALTVAARRRAAACADELILTGFACESTRTPVERAIARRAAWLERPRTRHRLAEHLRWRLQLANYTLIREMADRLDRGPADPRALVLLWSVVSAPPLDRSAVGPAAGE